MNLEPWVSEITTWHWQILDRITSRKLTNQEFRMEGAVYWNRTIWRRTYLQQITALHDKAKSRKYCLTPKVKAYLRVFPSIIRAKSFSFRRASPRVVQWRLRVSLVACKIKQKHPQRLLPFVLLRCLQDVQQLHLVIFRAFMF